MINGSFFLRPHQFIRASLTKVISVGPKVPNLGISHLAVVYVRSLVLDLRVRRRTMRTDTSISHPLMLELFEQPP